ncbi:hypothetical protein TPHV1_310023 [Treponema phagedenis]|uniref:Alpha/beta hydrolase n=1 Tax=Treponema phagedenis TaxID=162 RepID=A0A0B7GUQ7_TREPH|nr:hypothetical protein [Treponema phagedenis]QSH95227.1 hypothetical protein C5O78_09335 [Treponema phagedenis]CEM62394.1 hypothetical protein TPHV1_310023 [Treponema phagedenis]
MDGYRILAVSGIDGKFEEFNPIEQALELTILKYSYDRRMSFKENSKNLNDLISSTNERILLLGWSIGAVLVAFSMDLENVSSAILINAFFCRSEVLHIRNIDCDEEVCIAHAPKTKKYISLIYGELDDKIPCSESLCIRDYYSSENVVLYSFPDSKHALSTFNCDEITQIIKEHIERSSYYEGNANNC